MDRRQLVWLAFLTPNAQPDLTVHTAALYFEDVTSMGCGARSQDIKHSSTTNSCTYGLSPAPPPCKPANRTLPDCHQPTQSHEVMGAVEGKTRSSMDFTTGTSHLSRRCSCLFNNNNSSSTGNKHTPCCQQTNHSTGWWSRGKVSTSHHSYHQVNSITEAVIDSSVIVHLSIT